jgi:co-chaperonin GroES (HSP10)
MKRRSKVKNKPTSEPIEDISLGMPASLAMALNPIGSDANGFDPSNTRDEYVTIRKTTTGGGSFPIRQPNPYYQPPKTQTSVSFGADAAMIDRAQSKHDRPAIVDRIKAALSTYESFPDDRVIVVTDDPAEHSTLVLPEDCKTVPTSGMVVLVGSKVAEAFPGCVPGKRVVWNYSSGATLPFSNKWEVKILRYSEILVVLKDDESMKVFEKATNKEKHA